MAELLEKQKVFTRLVASLIAHADSIPTYSVVLCEAERPQRLANLYAKMGLGITKSLHRLRLAVDINLYINDVYQEKSEAYEKLGEYWESLSTPDFKCAWGGYFSKPDGRHFSLEYEGIK